MAGEFQQRALVHDFNVQRFARGMNGPAPHLIIKKHQSNGHTNTPSNTQPAAFSFSHSFMDVSRGRARDGRNHHAAPHACRHITRGVAAARSSPMAHQEGAWAQGNKPARTSKPCAHRKQERGPKTMGQVGMWSLSTPMSRMSMGKESPAINKNLWPQRTGSHVMSGWSVHAVAQTAAMSGVLSQITLRSPPGKPGANA